MLILNYIKYFRSSTADFAKLHSYCSDSNEDHEFKIIVGVGSSVYQIQEQLKLMTQITHARSMIRVRYQYLLSNSIYLFMIISCIRKINDK